MLFATQSTSIAGTRKYFETVLTKGDYYLGQEVAGHWHGKGAELLGLGEGSQVTKEQFDQLLRGFHPLTGEKLTQRIRKDRRPGVDLTFSVPKSVSLAWAVLGDEQVVEALRSAVHETMREEVEPLMQRRVRQGRNTNTQNRTPTGKLLYADFLHKTSRPVDGAADPHLHIHAFTMNWTEEGGRHYAGEFEEIIRRRPALQAMFEARLARKLQRLGYAVEHVQYVQGGRLKQGWEISGVERSTIEKFSRRTAQVEQYAAEHGVEDTVQKGRLGILTRDRKDNGRGIDELRREWRSRLTAEEWAAFRGLKQQRAEEGDAAEDRRAMESANYAVEHHLYRQSTVELHQIVATALEHGLTLRAEAVERALDRMDLIQREVEVQGSTRRLITTRAVLEAEQQMIAFARDGRGTRKAITPDEHQFKRDWLNEHQQAAVRYVLHSRDAVMAVVGGAGTGKTSLMTEAVEGVRKTGKEVFTFAPSTDAREVLQGEGFRNAETVEHLIRNTALHRKLSNQVIWVDEAGLLDVRSMNAVFKIAREQNARVVLSGDTRQHASPRRGEAMRLLEREAGLNLARADIVQRQRGRYRKAVELISKGYEVVEPRTGKTGLLAGYDLLDAMGKIKELPKEETHARLAKSYLKASEKGKSTLVVAPTHAEARAATDEIRSRLQEKGKLSDKEKTFTQYRPLNLSEAQKGEARTYAQEEGMVVQFHQNTRGGFQRGERYRVAGVRDGRVELRSVSGTQKKFLPLDVADRFEAYSQEELRVAAGDKVRFTLGGTTQDGKSRISNGRLDEVKGFDRRGNLVLKNGWVVDKDFAHVDLGYVITSHASQGKDCDVALAAMGSQSLPAINAKQFYVTVSRGRKDVTIYVDDKRRVREAIQRSGEQLSASEVVRPAAAGPVKDRPTKQQQNRRSQSQFRDRLYRWLRRLGGERRTQAGGERRSPDRMPNPIDRGMAPSPGRSR